MDRMNHWISRKVLLTISMANSDGATCGGYHLRMPHNLSVFPTSLAVLAFLHLTRHFTGCGKVPQCTFRWSESLLRMGTCILLQLAWKRILSRIWTLLP